MNGFYNPSTLQRLLLILKVYVVHSLCNYYHLQLFYFVIIFKKFFYSFCKSFAGWWATY